MIIWRTEPTDADRQRLKAFLEDYREQHRCCPRCGSDQVSTTFVGYSLDSEHPEDYRDMNVSRCFACDRWCGRVHDRVPAGSVPHGVEQVPGGG